MSKLGIKTMFLIPVMVVLVLFSAGSIHAQSELNIPDWIKDTAGFWADGAISDQEFVAALQFLINDGIITVPGSTGDSTSVESGSIELPDYPVEGSGPSNNVVDVTEEWSITGGFAESSYDSGDPITLSFVTDAPRSAGIKIGIFDSNDELIYTDVISAVKDEFGGDVQSEATVPRYYNMDEKLTMSYFLVGANDNKFSSSTTIQGPRVNLEVDSKSRSDITNTATVKLADAVTEDIRIRIFDSDRVVVYDDTVTTNDFGTANVEYTIPPYYMENEQISIRASFADDPNVVERSVDSTVPFTKTGLTITADKDAHYANEEITITVKTDPPVSADIRLKLSGHWGYLDIDRDTDDNVFGGGSTHLIRTDADGIAIITGYLDDHSGFNGFGVYTDDNRFELAERLSIPLTKAGLTITADKSSYIGDDKVTITVKTDPPVSADIRLKLSGHWGYLDIDRDTDDNVFGGGSTHLIRTDADGIAIITGYLDDHSGFNGFGVYTEDNRFELAERLTIRAR